MTVQVYVPQKRDRLQENMGRANSVFSTVAGIKGMVGGGGSSPLLGGGGGGGYNLGVTPMKPITEGMSGSLPEYTGSSYAAPEAAGGAEASGGATTGAEAYGGGMSAGSAGMWGATVIGAGSGLYDLYHAGKGNKSRSDLNRAVKSNTGQDLLDWGIAPGKAGKAGYNDQGMDYFTKFGQTSKAVGWDSDAASRRLGSMRDAVKPQDFFEARKTVDLLPISRSEKDDMLSKLTQGFGIFSKLKGMG